MENSFEYLNKLASNDTSIFGGFYRFSMNIGKCFMYNENMNNSNIILYTLSCIYSLSTIVVLVTYQIYDDDTFNDNMDDIEFLVFNIGMFISNILVFFARYDKQYSFIYLSIFKLVGYMSQYYYVYVISFTKILFESFFYNVIGKIIEKVDNIFDYVYIDDTTNAFWVYSTLVCVGISFVIFLLTGSPLTYLFTFMGLLSIVLATVIVGFIMLILPVVYVLCLIMSMYLWGLVFFNDFQLFIREIYAFYGLNAYVKQNDNGQDKEYELPPHMPDV